MTGAFWMPLAVLATSLVTAIALFALKERQIRTRTALNLGAAILKLGLVAEIVRGTAVGVRYETRIPFAPGLELLLTVDPIALLFVTLSAVLWLVTTVYAIGYLEGAPNRSRFFGFFSLCVTATMGIAFSGNLLTFFIFYELLTIATYPLVVHRETAEALRAGRVYLVFTLGGGSILLVGVVWSYLIAGEVPFVAGGALSPYVETHAGQLRALFAVLIVGLGVKAALVPLHAWLPEAMVAPAPVSALLHAVAVVKAGAYGIVRVVYEVFGLPTMRALDLLAPLAAIAAVTILYGSLRALTQQDLKRRLAYSTVSQLSYITLGAALFGPIATTGALVHLVHQGLMKITLFFCAGNIAETLGRHRVRDMAGLGRRMPLTMAAFTVAAFGMIGVPPVAGFVTKWHLGLGGLAAGEPWVVWLLVTSSILNAAYFLPVVGLAFFVRPRRPWKSAREAAGLETRATLLFPTLATALLSLLAGLLAAAPFSPLALAEFATRWIYEATP